MKVYLYQLMCLLGCLVLTINGAYAQSVVSGRVTSTEDGSALPGVNVIVKGTSSRSEEHTSELQSQSTISYAVFCLKKKKQKTKNTHKKEKGNKK